MHDTSICVHTVDDHYMSGVSGEAHELTIEC